MGDVIGPDEVIDRIRARRRDSDDKWKIMIARLQQTKGDTAGVDQDPRAGAGARGRAAAGRQGQRLPLRRDALPAGLGRARSRPTCYKKLLEMAPDDMTALNNLACLLAEVDPAARPEDGLKYSQRAYDLMQRAGGAIRWCWTRTAGC